MNGPLPSTWVFLADLPTLPSDTKVRFLGCVRTYNISAGHLILEHNYPRRRPPQEAASVTVDVKAITGSLTAEELRVGAWVNVVGYVRPILDRGGSTDPAKTAKSVSKSDPAADGDPLRLLYVEAVLVFSAGAIALGEYERVLNDSLEVDRRVERPGL